jgi:superfamily II DNA or RNA helicase
MAALIDSQCAQPGVYIAHHRWLDHDYGPGAQLKVGHTGDLGARLCDGAYTTCFPPGWHYVAAFELATKADAQMLEAAVLHCCRHRRVEGRELVRAHADELKSVVAQAAATLGLPAVRRDLPVYAPKPRRPEQPGSTAPNLLATCPRSMGTGSVAHLLAPAARAAIEAHTLEPFAPLEALEAPDALEALISELFELGGAAPPSNAPPSAAVAPPSAAAESQEEDAALGETDDLALAAAMSALAEDLAEPYDLRAAPLEDRGYQRDAVAACLSELRREGKAILQMACRCGKTPVAYGVLQDYFARGASVSALILVPGLPLLRQTAQKLASYGYAGPLLLVGSDPRPVALPGGRAHTMTTDPRAVSDFVSGRDAPAGPRLVVSTYQSSPLVPTGAFALTVYDEAHRVCGGRAARPFNHAISAPRVGDRLYMTATPAYDPPSKMAITMKDTALFGGVAYRYHLRQGIAAGHVNDFRLQIVAAPDAGGADAAEAALPAQILAAMATVDKLLVFCRNIGHATRLCAELARAPRPDAVAPFECLAAHSRQAAGGAAAALRRFAAPGRAVLFNCRLFQEGVEIPALNGVFFAAPRHSPRDIIQSVCRPLNRGAGKPPSVVFIPTLHDPTRPGTDAENLARYATIVPFVDALLDEDPCLYEHLLDPAGSEYPLRVLGTHTLRLETEASRAQLLSAVQRAVRYSGKGKDRLLATRRVPWDRAFAEIRRIVETCGRYPKGTDAWRIGDADVGLHRYYDWARRQYAAWQRGEPTQLEPHQISALAGLRGWEPYGVEGPYPWRECMAFLEQWLREHGGVPPMVEINMGGYVGLEATAMERLSGVLTTINQQDGKDQRRAPKGAAGAAGGRAARRGEEEPGLPGSGYKLSAEKQADLARICAPYGLRWRRERNAAGSPIEGDPTFIQAAFARFKEYRAQYGDDSEYIQHWFPDFPKKHERQESLDVQAAGLAPPRYRGRGKTQITGAKAARGRRKPKAAAAQVD